MKIRTFTRWFAACALASVFSLWASLSISGAQGSEMPRNAPATEYTELSKDGKATYSSSELTFGWVTDGRAVFFIIWRLR